VIRELQQRAAHVIELISAFVAGRFLFYYSVAATEIRIPAAMRRA
jgi:hypothetical protein